MLEFNSTSEATDEQKTSLLEAQHAMAYCVVVAEGDKHHACKFNSINGAVFVTFGDGRAWRSFRWVALVSLAYPTLYCWSPSATHTYKFLKFHIQDTTVISAELTLLELRDG